MVLVWRNTDDLPNSPDYSSAKLSAIWSSACRSCDHLYAGHVIICMLIMWSSACESCDILHVYHWSSACWSCDHLHDDHVMNRSTVCSINYIIFIHCVTVQQEVWWKKCSYKVWRGMFGKWIDFHIQCILRYKNYTWSIKFV